MHRWHITVPDELAGRVEKHLDGRPLSAFVRRAVEQALGSPGRAGVRGRVPAPVPAEQPYDASKRYDTFEEAVAEVPPGRDAVIPVYSSRVRSSAAARPFRPAPKKGEK